MHSEVLPHGISRRHPVASSETKESAELAVTVLQAKVAELARTIGAKSRLCENDVWFLSANPRFSVVSENELSRQELVVIRDHLNRLESLPGENQPVEERLLRLFLPHMRGLLAQCTARAPGNTAAPTEPARSQAGEPISLAEWAVGIGAERCILFRKFKDKYRDQLPLEISAGRQKKLLEQFAQRGGHVSRSDAVKSDPVGLPERNLEKATKLLKTIKSEISKIRASIRNGIARAYGTDASCLNDDPLPWSGDGWSAKIKIGYAVTDQSGRYQFRTYQEMKSSDH